MSPYRVSTARCQTSRRRPSLPPPLRIAPPPPSPGRRRHCLARLGAALLAGALLAALAAPATADNRSRAPLARLTVKQVVTPALTVLADGTGSATRTSSPIAGYQFDFGDGSPTVTVNAPSTTASHSYAAPGVYGVSLVVFDAANHLSPTVRVAVPVAIERAPVARLSVTQVSAPAFTVFADGRLSTDDDASPIATYQFDFGDSTPVRTCWLPSVIPFTVWSSSTLPARSNTLDSTVSPLCVPPPRLSTVTELLSYPYSTCSVSLAFLAPKNAPAWSASLLYRFHSSDGQPLLSCQ